MGDSIKYRYSIPLSGEVIAEGNYQNLSTYDKVGSAMNKMKKYRHLFPNGGEAIRDYDFEVKDGQAQGISIEANVKLKDGLEHEFANSLQRQLTKYKSGLTVTGDATLTDVQGQMPDKLYHLTDRKYLETICTEGLIPGKGANIHDETGSYVYLCTRDEIAV